MNKFFIKDIVEDLECELNYEIDVVNQNELKDLLIEFSVGYDMDSFPMISFEQTNDSNVSVDFDESKFLNDPIHDCTWLIGKENGEIIFVLGLKSHNETLEIDAFEVNINHRKEGIASNVLSSVEYIAERYFNLIELSAFDTDAMNFWEHMEYKMNKFGKYIKNIDEDY